MRRATGSDGYLSTLAMAAVFWRVKFPVIEKSWLPEAASSLCAAASLFMGEEESQERKLEEILTLL